MHWERVGHVSANRKYCHYCFNVNISLLSDNGVCLIPEHTVTLKVFGLWCIFQRDTGSTAVVFMFCTPHFALCFQRLKAGLVIYL